MIISTDTAVFLLFAIVALVAGYALYIDLKLRRVLRGKSGNIDESISKISAELNTLHGFKKNMEDYLLTVEKRLKSSIQGVETIRFDAFDGTGTGGNQSFATAMIDENKNGVVISGIHSRGFVGIYAKPIEKGSSKHDLSKEEKEAVSRASAKVKTNG
jgi:hypothetical protein